jgi:hypothetical protein
MAGQFPPAPLLLTITDEAALLNCSPRKVKSLRASDPAYPKGRQLGGTVYRTLDELRAYVAALPQVAPRPEPEQLKRGRATARLTPVPEAWPRAEAAHRMPTASRGRQAISAGASSSATKGRGE